MSDIKVVVFGSGAVGKSAFIIQFVQGYFLEDYDPTIEDCYRRVINVDDELCHLDILDTAGQNDFAPMRTSYIRQGKAFILLYSIDDRASFEEIEYFYQDLMKTKQQDIPIILCGNKCDLEKKRTVSYVEGLELAKNINATFFETSAFQNYNINEAFDELVRKVRILEAPPSPKNGKGKINNKNKVDKKKKACILL